MTSRGSQAAAFLMEVLSRHRVPPEAIDTTVEYLSSLPATDESLDEMTGFLSELTQISDDGLLEEMRAYLRLRQTEMATSASTPSQNTILPPMNSPSSTLSIELSSFLSREGGSGSSKDSTVCGCMATRHPYSGSCLGCGRLFCEREQLGKCFFCGGAACAPCSADDLTVKGFTDEAVLRAYRHKDKLLLFDKENSRRTQVFDAQVYPFSTTVYTL